MKQRQIAWAAGLFEGEGCISQSNGYWRLAVKMTDEDIVLRFGELFGLHHDTYDDPRPRCSRCYIASIGSRKAVLRTILLMMPYLGDRRKAKALDATKDIIEWHVKRRVKNGLNQNNPATNVEARTLHT